MAIFASSSRSCNHTSPSIPYASMNETQPGTSNYRAKLPSVINCPAIVQPQCRVRQQMQFMRRCVCNCCGSIMIHRPYARVQWIWIQACKVYCCDCSSQRVAQGVTRFRSFGVRFYSRKAKIPRSDTELLQRAGDDELATETSLSPKSPALSAGDSMLGLTNSWLVRSLAANRSVSPFGD